MRNKRKVVLGIRVTLPANFPCKPGLSFNPLARVILAVGLPYLLVNRALDVNPVLSNSVSLYGEVFTRLLYLISNLDYNRFLNFLMFFFLVFLGAFKY